MRTKIFLLVAGFAAFLGSDVSASIDRVILSSSENAVHINSARVVRAIGGGSYVTGMAELSFGYSNPRSAYVHIAAYDVHGKLLAEKIDKINSNRLQRWHLRPTPRASYIAFFPWEPSQIARVTVTEHTAIVSIPPRERPEHPTGFRRAGKPFRLPCGSTFNLRRASGFPQRSALGDRSVQS